jgi:transketolase
MIILSVSELLQKARTIRAHVLRMSSVGKASHVASALSCVEIMVTLYFRVARVDPSRAKDSDRDRVILSKGHGCATLYACLAERGFMEISRLSTYAADGSALAEHPSYGAFPGIEATTGSLGHGLGIATGLALAAKIQENGARVFVVLSDGECNEGSTWEAALWAPRYPLDNLTVIIDFNKLQASGRSTEITQLQPMADKWRAFGWDTVEVDGHDFEQLVAALTAAEAEQPHAVIAHTIKGKGVSFMENDLEWHYRSPNEEDLRRALDEIGGGT